MTTLPSAPVGYEEPPSAPEGYDAVASPPEGYEHTGFSLSSDEALTQYLLENRYRYTNGSINATPERAGQMAKSAFSMAVEQGMTLERAERLQELTFMLDRMEGVKRQEPGQVSQAALDFVNSSRGRFYGGRGLGKARQAITTGLAEAEGRVFARNRQSVPPYEEVALAMPTADLADYAYIEAKYIAAYNELHPDQPIDQESLSKHSLPQANQKTQMEGLIASAKRQQFEAWLASPLDLQKMKDMGYEFLDQQTFDLFDHAARGMAETERPDLSDPPGWSLRSMPQRYWDAYKTIVSIRVEEADKQRQRGFGGRLYAAMERGKESITRNLVDLGAGPIMGDYESVRRWKELEAIVYGAKSFQARNIVERAALGAGEMAAPAALSALMGGAGAVGKGASALAKSLSWSAPTAFWIGQIAPGRYEQMRASGISHEIAAPMAFVSAVPEAIVENLQVRQLLPRGAAAFGARDAAYKTLWGYLAYCKDEALKVYAKEFAEEAVQGGIFLAAEAIADHLDKESPGVDWRKELEGTKNELIQASLALIPMILPGQAVSAVGGLPEASMRVRVQEEVQAQAKAEATVKEMETKGIEIPKPAAEVAPEALPPAQERPAAAVKQPWEMTLSEVMESPVGEGPYQIPERVGGSAAERIIRHRHATDVEAAVLAEKAVPRAVLEDYRGQPWADAALEKMREAPTVQPAAGATVPPLAVAYKESQARPPPVEPTVSEPLAAQFTPEQVGPQSASRFQEVAQAAADAAHETVGMSTGLAKAWRAFVTFPARLLSNIPDDNPVGVLRDHIGHWFASPEFKRPATWFRRLQRRGGAVAQARAVASEVAKTFAASMKAAGADINDPATHLQVEYALRGEVDPATLAKPLQMWVQQARVLMDTESTQAAKIFRRLGMESLAQIYEQNVGRYLKNIPLETVSPTKKTTAFLASLVGPRLSRSWGKMKRDKWAVKVDGRVTKYETEEEGRLAYRQAIDQKKDELITKRGQQKEWELTRRGKVPRKVEGKTELVPWEKTETGVGVDAQDLYRQAARRVELIDPIPAEWRIENEIHNPAYLLYQSIVETRHNAVTAQLFAYAAEKWGVQGPKGSAAAIQEWADRNGLAELPGTGRLHDLAGMFVPKAIAEDLTEFSRVPSTAAKIYRAYITAWKASKTIYNPATHARNIMGNFIFAYLAKTSVWNPANWRYYYEAILDLAERGVDTQEAIRYAFIGTEFYGADIKALRDSIVKLGDLSRLDQFLAGLKAIHQAVGNTYALEDQIFKVAAFKIYKARGMSAARAAEEVNRWFPNYARVARLTKIFRQTPFLAPFASFIDQSARIAGRAFADRPIRLLSIAAFPYVLSYMSTLLLGIPPEEKELIDKDRSDWEPIVPFRDEQGRVLTLDLRYIMPLANDIVPEIRGDSIVRVPWFLADPLGQAIVEQMVGRDLFTGRSFVPMSVRATEKEKAAARAWKAAKTIVPHPTLLSYGLKRMKESATGERQEPLAMAVLGAVLGVNIRAPYVAEKRVRDVAKAALDEGDEKLAQTILDYWNNTYKPPYKEKLELESISTGLKQSKAAYKRQVLTKAAEFLLRKDTEAATKTINDYNAELTNDDERFNYGLEMRDVEDQAAEFVEKGKTR